MATKVLILTRVLCAIVLGLVGLLCLFGTFGVLVFVHPVLEGWTGVALLGSGLLGTFLFWASGRLFKTTPRLPATLMVFGVLLIGCLNARHITCCGIEIYQRYISPYKGWHCAHCQYFGGPSCSEFGKQAIAAHGIIEGFSLLQQRFRECSQAAALLHNRVGAGGEKGSCDGGGTKCYEGCNKGAKRDR